jgi:hypothetical protein
MTLAWLVHDHIVLEQTELAAGSAERERHHVEQSNDKDVEVR